MQESKQEVTKIVSLVIKVGNSDKCNYRPLKSGISVI